MQQFAHKQFVVYENKKKRKKEWKKVKKHREVGKDEEAEILGIQVSCFHLV